MPTGCPLPLQVTSEEAEEAELEQSAGEVPAGAGAPGMGRDLWPLESLCESLSGVLGSAALCPWLHGEMGEEGVRSFLMASVSLLKATFRWCLRLAHLPVHDSLVAERGRGWWLGEPQALECPARPHMA